MTKQPEDKFVFRRGMKVVCKDDPKRKVGRVLAPPPAIIGDPRNPRGVFPIELPGLMYVEFMYGRKKFVCLERVDNLEVVTAESEKKRARRVARKKRGKG